MSTCILKLLPFTTINLTELADWSPTTGPLAVTNNDFSDSRSASEPVRGNVTTNAKEAMDSTVTSYARTSNSGLLDLSFDAISPADATTLTDTQLFKVGGGDATETGSELFWVMLTMPTEFAGTPQVSYITGALSSKGCAASGTGVGVYTQKCNVSNGSASAGLGVDDTMAVLLNGYNKSRNTTDNTALGFSCNYGGGDTDSGWPTLSPNGTSYPVNVCPNYNISSATNKTKGETASKITISDDGLSAESALIQFTHLDPDDEIAVEFDASPLSTVVKRPASCYYTCNKGENKGSCKGNSGDVTIHFAEPATCP